MKEVDSHCLSSARADFNKDLEKYNKEYDKKTYSKRAVRKQKNMGIELTFRDIKGLPKFRAIKKNDFSYRTHNQSNKGKWDQITLENGMLKIPKIKTKIKVKNHRALPENSIIKNCTISMDAKGIYYCSLCVEYEIEVKKVEPKEILGLDYSQMYFYVDSENKRANYPSYYKKAEEKLKKDQRKLSRKKIGSNNWKKRKRKVTILQMHIANQRKDWIHKKSKELAEKYDVIIFEDIDLRNMAQCLKLGKNLHDNGFGMFRIFVQYKLEERGKQFIKIDKWYASSKICNCCGYKYKELSLNEREWTCPECKNHHDRDYNAALNIRDCGKEMIEKKM